MVNTTFAKQDETTKLTMSNAQRKTYNEFAERHSKALWFIMQGVEKSIHPKIEEAKSAKEACNILQTVYQGIVKVIDVNLHTLRRNFEMCFMKGIEYVDKFMTQDIKHTINQLRTHGENIFDQQVIEEVLRSLPEKYDTIIVAIEESEDLSKLYVEQLMGSLLSHETRLWRSNSSLESAFQSQAFINRSKGKG